ncbi:MAG: ABC transporter ATP-binding protein/permease [Clostridiales bacterium]|nr:ABC transporter ATP-binding protein/permease [Clostridiales bacterium]MDY6066916.1 ABC transporter ATP-binding protein [Candidatus Faecousia sp.]
MKRKTNPENGKTLKKLWNHIAKFRVLLILSVLMAGATVILQLYVPILFGDAIDNIVAAGKVDFTMVGYYLKRVVILAVLSGVTGWVMSVINNRMTYRVVQDIRAQSIRHIQRLPLSYLDKHSSGDIVSRIIADADILSDGLLMGFSQLFSGIVTIVVTLVFMFSKNFWITLLVICLTPVSFWVAKFISSHSYGMFRKQSEARGKQTALIDEIVGNQKVVRAYGYEERASKRFAEINGELRDYSAQAVFYSSLTNPCTRFVNSLIYAGVALLGAILIPVGSLTVGGLTVLLSYANQYMKPFNDISSVVTEMQNALACAARLFALLEEPEESEDAAGTLEAPRGNVGIEDVSFSYDPNRKLIEHFNLDVKPGMRIAIVGPTGCGKTTFINLLMRFYDTDKGEITVDGKEIKTLSRHALRSGYGMVLQDTWIKQGSVRENIAFGKPDATDEEIIRAAKEAHSWEFIERLPQGLDTVLYEDSISQGQKQLLCITRVMLTLPPMLILDEATSSIDTRTEMLIQQAFDKLMEGRTSFVVAHRLSTIRNASLILVMRDGKIIEQGTHEELLSKGGFYYTLYNSQFQRV